MTERDFILSRLSPAERSAARQLGVRLDGVVEKTAVFPREPLFVVDHTRKRWPPARTSSVIRPHRPEVA